MRERDTQGPLGGDEHLSYVGLQRIVLSGSVIVCRDEETLIDEGHGVSLTLRFNRHDGDGIPSGYRDGDPSQLLIEMPKTAHSDHVLYNTFSEVRHEVRVVARWHNAIEKVVHYTVLERRPAQA